MTITPCLPVDDAVLGLSDDVRRSYERVVATDPNPMRVESYITCDAAAWAAGQAVRDLHVPCNQASVTALTKALSQLDEFYAAELTAPALR